MQLLSFPSAIFAVIVAYLHSIDGDPLCPITPIQNCTAFTERVKYLLYMQTRTTPFSIKYVKGIVSGKKCYAYAFEKYGFTKAKQTCVDAGGMLAWAKNTNSLKFVNNRLLSSANSSGEYIFWIGLEKLEQENWSWTCPRGSLKAGKIDWAVGEPDDKFTLRDYGGLMKWNRSTSNISLHAEFFSYKYHFLCEADIGLLTTTEGTTSVATTEGATSMATTTVQTYIKTTVTEATSAPSSTIGSSSNTATEDKHVSSIATAPLTTEANVVSPTELVSDNSVIFAIVGVGVLLLLIGLVVAAVFVSRKRKKAFEHEGSKSAADESEGTSSLSANDGSSFATVQSMGGTESSMIGMLSLNEHPIELPRGDTPQQCTQTPTCKCGICLSRKKMWDDDGSKTTTPDPEPNKNTGEDTEMASMVSSAQ